MMFIAYRIKDNVTGWRETRFSVQIHIVKGKGETVAFLETFRPTREEALEAVQDACTLYSVTKTVDCGEKGFDKPHRQTLDEREALLAMSVLATMRSADREAEARMGRKAVWTGARELLEVK